VGAAANARPADLPGAAGTGPADTPAGRAAQLRETRPQPPVVVDEMPPQQAPMPMPMQDPRTSPQAAGAMPAMPRRAGGMRRWAWLIGAAGLVVVGVVVVGVVVVQNLRSGYYVGQEGGQVVLYRGTPQELPVIKLNSKAAAQDQPNPPIMVADLPETQQQAVRETYPVNGPGDLAKLRGQVCKHMLSNERGQVVVVRGKGQQNCQQTKIKDGRIPITELPDSDRAAIEQNKKSFDGLRAADTELSRLQDRRTECKKNRPSITDCPGGGGRS
jgi:protein phosphatase